jgi:hypothetical protein
LNHQTKGSKSFASQVKREIAYFEDVNIKSKNFLQTTLLSVILNKPIAGRYLKLAYNYLMTIRPTSVDADADWAFSAAGCIVRKIQSRLGDHSIDGLCFLRSHFKNDKNFKNACN